MSLSVNLESFHTSVMHYHLPHSSGNLAGVATHIHHNLEVSEAYHSVSGEPMGCCTSLCSNAVSPRTPAQRVLAVEGSSRLNRLTTTN